MGRIPTNRKLRLLLLRGSSLQLAGVLLLAMAVAFAGFRFEQSRPAWLILLAALLALALLAVLLRLGPVMWRDMVHYRRLQQVTRIQAMHNHVAWRFDAPPQKLAAQCESILLQQGYHSRQTQQAGLTMISAMRGRLNRLGFILSHTAVLLILLGALLDSDLGLTYQLRTGRLQAVARDVALNNMHREQRIPARSLLAFQGTETLQTGQMSDEVKVTSRQGYVAKHLPFAVAVSDVELDASQQLQEDNFLTRIAILDPKRNRPVQALLGTNRPFRYQGLTYYQQAVRDAGSELSVTMWPLQHARSTPLKFHTRVGNERQLQTRQGTIAIRFADLKPRNVMAIQEAVGSSPEYKNIGPSLFYRVSDALSRQREFVNYLLPILQDGRYFYISGMRDQPDLPFSFIHIPVDQQGGLGVFFALHAAMFDPPRVEQAIRKVLHDAGKTPAAKQGKAMQDTLRQLLVLFRQGGFAAIDKNIASRVTAANYEQSRRLSNKMVRSLLYALYTAQLHDASQQVEGPDLLFFEDALPALSRLAEVAMPFYIQLQDMHFKPAVSLLVSYKPGEFLFFSGWVMLLCGLAAAFYGYHRRLWLLFRADGGVTMVSMAGMGNRQQQRFAREFNELFTRLQKAMQA